jgi:hypothetical protein
MKKMETIEDIKKANNQAIIAAHITINKNVFFSIFWFFLEFNVALALVAIIKIQL